MKTLKLSFLIDDSLRLFVICGLPKAARLPLGWEWLHGYHTRGAWATHNKRAFAEMFRIVRKTSVYSGCVRRRVNNEPARRIA